MEFSDEYSTFQIKPLHHSISADFSTDFAKCLRLKRTRTRSSNSLNSGDKKNSSESKSEATNWTDRRTLLSLSFIVTILIAIVLPLFQQSRPASDDYDKYITVTDAPKIVRKEIDSASNSEALKSVHAALDMKKLSKIDKARRLLEHAVALSPHNVCISRID